MPVIGDELASRIRELAFTQFGSGRNAAPPCVQQEKFSPGTRPTSATETQFPHVTEALSGSTRRGAEE